MAFERFPLHLLPAFVVAARLENLRAAAQQIHLTHGAVSQQIQQLERAIGHPLFERQGRGIKLNAAGRELLAVVEQTLTALQQGIGRVRRVAASQVLRISVLPSFAHYWLLPRLPVFRQACPEIALDIDASLRVQDLARGGFDAAIRIGGGQWPGLHAEWIAPGDVVPVAAPAVAQQWRVEFAQGAQALPLLAHDVMPWRCWWQAEGKAECGQQLALFNDASLLVRAAQQGFGIALVKTLLAGDALATGALQALAAPRRLEDNDYYLVWPKGAEQPAAVRALLLWLQGELTSAGRAGGG